jgi:drug/metabolite transporter (DMT)-like permease
VSAPPTATPSLPGRTTASRAAWAAGAASIFFGASVVATRYVVPQTTPVVLAFVRYVVATSCLLVVLGRRAFPVMPGRDRVQVALLGVLFFGVFPWSFSASLTHLPAAQVALIVATNPLVTLALSVWRGIEPLRARAVIGQLLAFAGLAVALAPTGAVTTGVSNPLLGYLEIATTVLCGATYNVWSRPLLARYDALAITAQSMLAGTIALAPLALAQGLFVRLPMVTPLGWATVLFLGIFGGAVGFGLWIWALRHSTPSRVAVFLALNPITAITLGVVLLGEPAGVRLFVALAMVIAGIQLASKKARASN